MKTNCLYNYKQLKGVGPCPVKHIQKIQSLLSDKFHGNADVRPTTDLTDLGLDSLTLMEFVFSIEDAFDIRIPEEKLDPREETITLEQVCVISDEIRASKKT